MTQEIIISLAEKMRKRVRAPAVVRVAKRAKPGPGTRGRRAKKLNGVELKFHDLDIDDGVVATGGTIAEDSCVTVAQGTTESTRIGRKMVVRAIGWRMLAEVPASNAKESTSDILRVILYVDKQTNGAAATVTDILETADFQSFNQLANKSRFRTLMDRTYSLSVPAGSGRGSTDTTAFGEIKIADTFFKNVEIPIEYDNSATSGAISTVRTNNIGVLTISSSGIASFKSKMRIRFSDG